MAIVFTSATTSFCLLKLRFEIFLLQLSLPYYVGRIMQSLTDMGIIDLFPGNTSEQILNV
jgi:hypothetical protein